MTGYFVPQGGHPPQTDLVGERAVFAEAYALIPAGVLGDIVISQLPFWERTRAWILARPMTGFSETFAHYLLEVAPAGGSIRPEPDPQAEGVLFVTGGDVDLTLDGQRAGLVAGGYAYIPPGTEWTLCNRETDNATLHWIRKRYQAVEGLERPDPIIAHDSDIRPDPMPSTEGRWATTRFVSPADMRHDMHVTIVTMEPGACIPFAETHVMEHGLYVLEGKAVYRLNRDWVEVAAGDYMWLRAFCPQACYAGGPGRFRYLLYKDVNRHPALTPGGL